MTVATVSQTPNTPTSAVQSQTQTLARIIKPGTSLIQSQVVQGTANPQSIIRTSAANQPIMAKVLTNSSGQIISLESLLQKQGIAQGTTLRVANAKQGQTSLIQLPSAPGSQITQYAVVSQGRNLISLGTPQRLITTQAQNTASNATVPKTENKQLTTVVQPEIQTIQQTAQQTSPQHQQPHQTIQTQMHPRIIQTSQVQSLSTQPIAKVVGVQNVTTNRIRPSIRMVAHIGGKPVIIAGKPQTNSIQQQQQPQPQQTSRSNVIWQSNQAGGTTTNYVINTQPMKVQQTNNVVTQFDPASPAPQTQTVLFGNQVVKLQSQTPVQQQSSQQSTNVVSGTIVNASNNSIVTNNTATGLTARTVVLGATGQPIRVQSPANIQAAGSGTVTLAQPQHVVLGQPLKVENNLILE